MIEQLVEDFDSVIVDTSAIGENIHITDDSSIVNALLAKPVKIILEDAERLNSLNLAFRHAYKVQMVDYELTSLTNLSYAAINLIKHKENVKNRKSGKYRIKKNRRPEDSDFEHFRIAELDERKQAIELFHKASISACSLLGCDYNGVRADGELFKQDLKEISQIFVDGRSDGKTDEQVISVAAELATQGVKVAVYSSDRRMLRLAGGIVYRINKEGLPISIFYANSQHSQIDEVKPGMDVRDILREYDAKVNAKFNGAKLA